VNASHERSPVRRAAGPALALAGVAVFLGMSAVTLYQFRRINGVRIDGLASQVVIGTGTTSTLVYASALGLATWASFESRWWLRRAPRTQDSGRHYVVDAAWEEAQRRGYEVVHPLTDEPWGIRRFFVRGPDGHVINVAQHRS